MVGASRYTPIFLTPVLVNMEAWKPEQGFTLYRTYLESFISICCRISCLSSSVLLGKMFLSSSSCLLGLFRNFTASNSFLHFLGKVPGAYIEKERERVRQAVAKIGKGTSLIGSGFSHESEVQDRQGSPASRTWGLPFEGGQ